MPSGLVINTNVPSLNGQRNLGISTRALSKSLERLSSGLRINRAADDAAGLAISEGLRTQVRGLDQAVRNANDGISLIQTADGAIATYTEILQRMRELAVQASSDVNSDDNRAAIQKEIDQQIEELERISTTVDFNGANLFDGTFLDKRIQVGSKEGQYLDVSIGSLKISSVGAVAEQTGVNTTATAFVAGDSIRINGIAVPIDPLHDNAIDKAADINSIFSSTNVKATVEDTTVTGAAIAAPATLDGTNNFSINGIQIGTASDPVAFIAGDGTGSLVRAINDKTNVTGVKASVDSTGALTLTAEDGRNIDITQNGTGATSVGLTVGTTGGKITLTSDEAYVIEDAGGGQALAKLGIAAGGYTVDPLTAINTIEVRSFELAQEALTKIDNALRQVLDLRADLGAVSNRLDATIQNLEIMHENLTASDSRIRDADFAVETANLTKNQILQQSGVAVLAQANATPQTALSLLQ